MSQPELIDWQDAFANADYIPDAKSYPDTWAARAAAFRKTAKGARDIAYGPGPREVLDLFLPETSPKGLAVIIHGGYWLAFDKSSWSDLAAGALDAGWAVAMPSYTLAPEATIPDITQQIGRAIAHVAKELDGPIRVTGHSAGGHLATRMMCETTPLATDVTNRIDRVVSISGVHDLRPLMQHSMNEKLGLTDVTATTESPALLRPLPGKDVIAWVGAHERPEFLRQSALLVEHWRQCGVSTRLVADPDKHHFDVIDGLKSADHPLTQCLVGA